MGNTRRYKMALTLKTGDRLPKGDFKVRKYRRNPTKYSSWGIIDEHGDFIKYHDLDGIIGVLDFGLKESAQEFIREKTN